ncbi:MAG: hypothetical protein WDM70_04685 [Nitrosomonadales bacterium]
MSKLLQEVLVYLVVGISSLFIMGFAMHMLVGGLVSPETEELLIVFICLLDLTAMGFMTRDVIRRRKRKK